MVIVSLSRKKNVNGYTIFVYVQMPILLLHFKGVFKGEEFLGYREHLEILPINSTLKIYLLIYILYKILQSSSQNMMVPMHSYACCLIARARFTWELNAQKL